MPEEKGILFYYSQNASNPIFNKIFGNDKDGESITNTYLRHSFTNWRIRINDPEITEQSIRIMTHTDKTARGVYVKRKRTILA